MSSVNEAASSIKLLTCVREVPGSKLDRHTGHPQIFLWFYYLMEILGSTLNETTSLLILSNSLFIANRLFDAM